jgi:hypothetical protein
MLNSNFVLLGAVFNLIGSITYVVHTIQGKTKPNRATWFLWALAPLIAFAAEIHAHVGLRSLMTFMVGFGPLMIFLSSFVNRKSYWKLAGFDYVCAALSLVAVVLWRVTDSGNVAILFSIIADGMAAIPTITKAYRYPETESPRVFLFGAISAGITLLTVKTWTFASWGFPAYILVCCLLIAALATFPRSNTRQAASARQS